MADKERDLHEVIKEIAPLRRNNMLLETTTYAVIFDGDLDWIHAQKERRTFDITAPNKTASLSLLCTTILSKINLPAEAPEFVQELIVIDTSSYVMYLMLIVCNAKKSKNSSHKNRVYVREHGGIDSTDFDGDVIVDVSIPLRPNQKNGS